MALHSEVEYKLAYQDPYWIVFHEPSRLEWLAKPWWKALFSYRGIVARKWDYEEARTLCNQLNYEMSK